MLIRLIAALRRNALVARAALYNLVLNIILNAVFMRIFGVAGIALSTSCVYAFSFCYVALALRRIARSTPPEAAS
jgi:putative peptidoglycan lipid II flippase